MMLNVDRRHPDTRRPFECCWLSRTANRGKAHPRAVYVEHPPEHDAAKVEQHDLDAPYPTDIRWGHGRQLMFGVVCLEHAERVHLACSRDEHETSDARRRDAPNAVKHTSVQPATFDHALNPPSGNVTGMSFVRSG